MKKTHTYAQQGVIRNFMQEAMEDNQLAPQSYPWLLVHQPYNELVRIFSISENRYYNEIIPELEYTRIYGSFYGWLVLEEYAEESLYTPVHHCLFNPITFRKIQLPTLEYTPGILKICSLSLPPSDPNSRILFIDNVKHVIFFCRPGDEEFIIQGFDWNHLGYPVMFKGEMYCPSGDSLVAITFVGSKLVMQEKGKFDLPSPSNVCCYTTKLVECYGELLLVRIMYSDIMVNDLYGISIFRFDFEAKMWMAIHTIGESTIFVSRYECMACNAAELGVKKNSVYFIRPRNRHYCIFDLEDDSLSMNLPCSAASSYAELHWSMLTGLNIENQIN